MEQSGQAAGDRGVRLVAHLAGPKGASVCLGVCKGVCVSGVPGAYSLIDFFQKRPP
jgi:hypothetical protein